MVGLLTEYRAEGNASSLKESSQQNGCLFSPDKNLKPIVTTALSMIAFMFVVMAVTAILSSG